MNIWITKNIRFGYRYTSDKNIRTQINNSTDWLIDTLRSKVKQSDIFILSGGLFHNTNPSIVAINDAHNFINRLKDIMNIVLVNSSKDTRLFDGVYYSTLDLFENIKVIKEVTTIENIDIIPFLKTHTSSNNILDSDMGTFNDDKIPNLMQIDETEDKPGLFVFNTVKNKYVIIENSSSPKHVKYTINTIDELVSLSQSNNKFNSHLIINNSLLDEHKSEVDILVYKINPSSVKYTSETIEKLNSSIIDISNDINIDNTIYKHIEKDEDLIKQFDRIKMILKNKNNIEI